MMCFGVPTGPYYFNLISEFIHEIVTRENGLKLVNYLDDFIVICDNYDDCLNAQASLIKAIRSLGFHISWHKVTPPSAVVQYLGIIVDSLHMELRLPEDKLVSLRNLLDKYSAAKFITKKDLKSLTGLLAHCSQCVKGGHTFCRRLHDLYKLMVNKDLSRARISNIVREDIKWWHKFSRIFNGVSAINNELYHEDIYTDASKKGFGAQPGSDWLAGTWQDPLPLEMVHDHILKPPSFDI